MTLSEVVALIETIDGTLTIFAAKPWRGDSEAIVAPYPDGYTLPPEAAANGLSYFVEVYIAQDIVQNWIEKPFAETTLEERLARVIYYAEHDA